MLHPKEEEDSGDNDEKEGDGGDSDEKEESGNSDEGDGGNNDEREDRDHANSDPNQLSSLVNSYKFTNQILVQQVNEWKTKCHKCEEKVSQSEQIVKRLEEEKQALLKENEEMRAALSQTDLTDYQFIDDSSQES